MIPPAGMPTHLLRRALLGALLLLPSALVAQQPADWTGWRGPQRTGTVTGVVAPTTWPPRLTKQWRSEVGLGYSTPLVVGGRVYTFGRLGENEVMQALDAATGAVVWRTAYPAPYALPSGVGRHGVGPKSTPAYAEGRLFSLGMSGILTAFDASTGKRLWQKPAPTAQPKYGAAMSPITDTGIVIAHVGGHDSGSMTAYDAATGAVRWSWAEGPAYSSPRLVELGGVRQLVAFTQEHVAGLNPATGAVLWKQPFHTEYWTNIISPIVYGDLVVVSANGVGAVAYRVSRAAGGWTVRETWKNPDVPFHMSNPVLRGTTLYGMSARNSGQFVALDVSTGKVTWTSRGREADNASFVDIGSALLILKDSAELLVARPSASGFDVIERYTVADSATYGQPAIVGNRIYIKDDDGMTVWSF